MSGYEELHGKTAEEPSAPETVAPEAAPEPSVQEPVAAEPTPAAVTQAPAPAPAADPMAPVKALLEERDRRQAAEREAAALRAWRADQERKAKEARAQAPNMLDDPDGYHEWIMEQRRLDREALEQRFERARVDDRLQTSRELIEDQLPEDEFKKLCAFIDTRPQQWHAHAERQAHPYRWALKQMRESEKAKRSEEVLSKLGEKSLEELIEEQVAARLAAQQAAAPAAPETPGQPRGPDGKFASPSTATRHQPPSLAVVSGAPAPRGSETPGGYEAAFRRG